jgi:hypothetical protein
MQYPQSITSIEPKGSIYVPILELGTIIDITTATTMDTLSINIDAAEHTACVRTVAVTYTTDIDHTTNTKNTLERDLQEEAIDEL